MSFQVTLTAASSTLFQYIDNQVPTGLSFSFVESVILANTIVSTNDASFGPDDITYFININPETGVPAGAGNSQSYFVSIAYIDPYTGDGILSSSSLTFTFQIISPPPPPPTLSITKLGDLLVNTTTYPSGITAQQLTDLLRSRVSISASGGQSFTVEYVPTPTTWSAPTTGSVTRSYDIRAVDGTNTTNYVTVVATYTVTDAVAPTITGPNTVSFVEDTATDSTVLALFTFTDNVTPSNLLVNTVTGIRNYAEAGTYNISINSRDQAGNTGNKSVVLTITAASVTDTIPPVANGPSAFFFTLAQNKRVSDVRNAFTVTDNVTPINLIDYEPKIDGSTVAKTYQFPLGITNLTLRFFDEADNYTAPIPVTVNVLDNDTGLIYNENEEKRQELVNLQDYSATMVSILTNDIWTPISWLVDPVTVNYTIDQTTDEININFLSEQLDNRLQAGTLVRVTYASTSDNRNTWGVPEYDAKDRPLNHDVMVVESGNMVKLGDQSVYRHNYKLAELITLLKDYRLPTLTYTSFTEVTVTDAASGNLATYYQRPTNALTIIQRAIRQAQPTTSVETSNLTLKYKIMDGIFLQGQMLGVDHQFQEATLYDVFTEIGRIIGRTPVMYLNPEYSIVDDAEFLIFFETDREHTIGTQTKANLLLNSTEFIESTVADKDKTEIVVDAHNVIGSKSTFYPSDDSFVYASAVNQELSTVGNASQMVIVLPNKISTGEKVYYRTYLTRLNVDTREPLSGYPEIGTLTELPLMRYNEWLVLEPDDREVTAYYKENENIVYLPPDNEDFTSEGYSFRAVRGPGGDFDEYEYVLYQVEYFPIMSFESRIGEGKQITFNQINAMVDSETLGVQVANYKKGNEGGDIVVSKIETSYPSVLKPTQMVNWDGLLYHITSVSFNTLKLRKDNKMITGYKVAYQLNRDIRRNANLNAPTSQREYQIPYENVFERYIVLKDKVKLHFTTNTKSESAPIISELKYLQDIGATDYRYILGALEQGGSNVYPTIETVAFHARSELATNSGFTTFLTQNKYIVAQVNKTIFGNSIVINFQMPNNVYAGTKIVLTADTTGERFQQRQVSYVDSFGKSRFIDIKYLWQDASELEELFEATDGFPELTSTKYAALTNTIAKILDWQIEKDSRETLNVSFQVDFEGVNGTKIGTNLLKGSAIYQASQTPPTYNVVELKNNFYEPNDIVNNTDFIGSGITVTQIAPLYSHGIQIIFASNTNFNTTSTYALVEQVSTIGSTVNYKIVAIMGDRTSLVNTDRLFIYY